MGVPVVAVEQLVAGHGLGRLRQQVLAGAGFTVPRGSLTVLTGPSGSGKTTLLSIVGGLERPESGRVVVDGLDLTALAPAGLLRFRRERVGFVFQDFQLLPHLTARENVEAALAPLRPGRAERRRRAGEALASVGLGALVGRFPHELSGGEQQRVAVARAAVKRPALLLADEPTGNLDAASATGVLALLAGERGRDGRTVLLVTHDERLARDADAHLVLAERRVERRR